MKRRTLIMLAATAAVILVIGGSVLVASFGSGPQAAGPILSNQQVAAIFEPPLAGFRVNPDAVDGAVEAPEGCPSVGGAREAATATYLLAGATGQGSALGYRDAAAAVAAYQTIKAGLGCSASGAQPTGTGSEGAGSWFVYSSQAGSAVGMSTVILQHGNVVVVLRVRQVVDGGPLFDEFKRRVEAR